MHKKGISKNMMKYALFSLLMFVKLVLLEHELLFYLGGQIRISRLGIAGTRFN
jgi:hypothetical protein